MKILDIKSKTENSQTFYNFLSTFIRSGIVFLTMPFFTRLLGAEQYGKYSIYSSWLALLASFMGCNVGSAIGTGIHRYRSNYKKFISSILVEGTLISGIIVLVGIMCSRLLGNQLHFPEWIIIVMLLEAMAQFVTGFAGGSWVYEKKAASNMLMSLGILIFTTVFSLLLLIRGTSFFSELYQCRVVGTAVPQITIAVIIWFTIFHKFPTGYNREYWRYGLSFGLPMIFHILSMQILVQSDRVMMEGLKISGVDIGVYSFFYSFAGIMSMILTALNNSWCPFFYEELREKRYDELNRKVCHYIHLYTTLSCGFLMLAREVVKIFADDEYWSGMPLLPILLLVYYSTYTYQFAVNYEFFYSKPRNVAIGTATAAVINIILNYTMIPRFGMYGAAIATLASYALLVVFHFFIVKTWSLERYPLKMTYLFVGWVGILAFSGLYYILEDFMIFRWGIGVLLGVQLIFFVYRRKTIF